MTPKLYLLTNHDPLPVLLEKLNNCLATGIIAQLQIRRKNTPIHTLPFEIEKILTLADRYGVPVIINDSIVLAKQFGVGVHLGQGDGDIVMARQQLGNTIIGRTCHTSLDFVKQAIQDKADYAAIGAVFASTTKPNALPLCLSSDELQLLEKLNNKIALCVIGGITVDNVLTLRQILPNIFLHWIAFSDDILGKPLSDIASHCQKWQQTLADF